MKKERKDHYWEMRDGNLINVKDMGDRHLNNTIKMIQEGRWHGDRKYWIKILLEEQDYRIIIYRKKKIDKIINNLKNK